MAVNTLLFVFSGKRHDVVEIGRRAGGVEVVDALEVEPELGVVARAFAIRRALSAVIDRRQLRVASGLAL